jgi:hypothetical protein
MKESPKFIRAVTLFDAENSKDPNKEYDRGEAVPKELLYAQRMSEKLDEFMPGAPEPLRLAVRCQHICRWEIPRDSYEMNRKGYLRWRNELKMFHAEKAAEILEKSGYDADEISEVGDLLLKKNLKKDNVTQALEDVVCLVFLEFYFASFAQKYAEETLIDILRKTWRKMSSAGQHAALKIEMDKPSADLVAKAISKGHKKYHDKE